MHFGGNKGKDSKLWYDEFQFQKELLLGAGEMAPWFRARGAVPSRLRAVCNPMLGFWCPLLASFGLYYQDST